MLPSLPYVTRSETIESLRKKKVIPGIPVTPVGYDDAQRILEYMDGPSVTRADWIGGLPLYKWNSQRNFRLNVRSRSVYGRGRPLAMKVNSSKTIQHF
ncbi:unnamed protein product [Heligmosomoides polygyrus]|uniref:Uncharacterized protein n=1 Tax=Heligmosomoides polygyrus TaxID=6339 RepID=A0A3P7WXL2_HELPZ|nr:unnamed protein product [Heligmosomoides polygyrus]